MTGVEVGQETGIFQETSQEIRGNGKSGSGSRTSTNRGRIRCFVCKVYDHFAQDFPNMKTGDNVEPEQIQQLISTEEEKNHFRFL